MTIDDIKICSHDHYFSAGESFFTMTNMQKIAPIFFLFLLVNPHNTDAPEGETTNPGNRNEDRRVQSCEDKKEPNRIVAALRRTGKCQILKKNFPFIKPLPLVG